jgi:hypothetical protein
LNKESFLGIIFLCIFGVGPCSLHAQEAIIQTAPGYVLVDKDEQDHQQNKIVFLPPVIIAGRIGNTSYYFSPGLGLDSSNGLNLGFDFGINQKIKNWSFSAGFGASLNYLTAGGFVSYQGIGAGYYTSFYGNSEGPDGQSNKQIVGGLNAWGKNFSVRFENDFLYKGDAYDRWRTAAIEIGIRNFVMGMHIYTNMPDKGNENYKYDENYNGSMWNGNRRAYSDGEVYRSIFYVGYRYRNRIIRIGVNHPVVQDIFQNGWHSIVNKPFFPTPYGQYFSFYIYTGYYNHFSLYGK